MLTSPVDHSWSKRVCLTAPEPSRATRLCLHARFVAQRLAHAMRAIAVWYSLLLQRASDDSPSFR